MPKYRVLKEMPQGQRPGEIVELPEEVGAVFLSVDAVELVTEESPKGRTKRRDLRSEA